MLSGGSTSRETPGVAPNVAELEDTAPETQSFVHHQAIERWQFDEPPLARQRDETPLTCHPVGPFVRDVVQRRNRREDKDCFHFR